MTLKNQVLYHNWNAEPDDVRAMTERIELVRKLCELPSYELSKVLTPLPIETSIQVLALMKAFIKLRAENKV